MPNRGGGILIPGVKKPTDVYDNWYTFQQMYMNFNNLHNRTQVLDRARECFDDLVANEGQWYPASVTTFAAASSGDAPVVKWNNPHMYLHFRPDRPIPKSITFQFYISGIAKETNCHWDAAIYKSDTLAYVRRLAYAEKSGGITAVGLSNGVYNVSTKPDSLSGWTLLQGLYNKTGYVTFTSYLEPVIRDSNLTDFKIGITAYKSYAAGTLNGSSYPAGNYTYWIRIRDLWLNYK